MSGPPTSEDSRKSTCSPESAAGPTPCGSPAGPTTSRSGPAHARVSRFRATGVGAATSTSGISGRLSTVSSPSDAPAIVFGEQVASGDGPEWLAGVRADLEDDGYAFGASNLSAAGVGAPHDRARLYFVAHAHDQHVATRPRGQHYRGQTGEREQAERGKDDFQHPVRRAPNFWADFETRERRRLKPGAQLLVDGFPDRLAQLYAFGNAIVPQLAVQFIIAAREAIEGLSRRERYRGLDAFDRANQRPAHRPAKSENVHSSGRPSGNSAAAFLRRLRTARPDLHARVLAGEISAYAGMIEAGWRTRPTPLRRGEA